MGGSGRDALLERPGLFLFIIGLLHLLLFLFLLVLYLFLYPLRHLFSSSSVSSSSFSSSSISSSSFSSSSISSSSYYSSISPPPPPPAPPPDFSHSIHIRNAYFIDFLSGFFLVLASCCILSTYSSACISHAHASNCTRGSSLSLASFPQIFVLPQNAPPVPSPLPFRE